MQILVPYFPPFRAIMPSVSVKDVCQQEFTQALAAFLKK
jgi:hypothetical protein